MKTAKILKFAFMFLGLTFLAGCSGYVEKDGKWYYKDWNEGWGTYYEPLVGVDTATFSVRKDGLGADKNKIWCRSTFVEADIVSFEALGGRFYRDKYRVFFRDYSSIFVLKDADSKTFRYIQGDYGADARSAYCQYERLDYAHIGSFTAITDYYATDEKNVWSGRILISEPRILPLKTLRAIDRKSFEDLGKGKARDKYGVILFGRPAD